MSGPDARWEKPVELSLSKSGSLKVEGPFQALAHLMDKWPAPQDLDFVRARSACRGAIAGHRSMDEARAAFEAAANKAREEFDRRRH